MTGRAHKSDSPKVAKYAGGILVRNDRARDGPSRINDNDCWKGRNKRGTRARAVASAPDDTTRNNMPPGNYLTLELKR